MAETHLGPNVEIHQTHLKWLQVWYRVGGWYPQKVTYISPPSDITGADQIKHTLSRFDQ